jgi:hypothetical protein
MVAVQLQHEIDMMAELFAGGQIIDLILLLVFSEVGALLLYRRATGRGPRLAAVGPTLASGVLLLLALRATIAGLWWGWTALALGSALVAHVLDLRRRWH